MSRSYHGSDVRSKLIVDMFKSRVKGGHRRGSALDGHQLRGESGLAADKAQSPPRVLFVSHEASRTGAVIALLRQVQWLVDNGLADPRFVIRSPGGLFAQGILEQFGTLGPTKQVSPREERLRRALRNRLGSRASRALDVWFAVRYWIEYRDVSVVWFNTVMNGPAHYDLSLLAAPRVCHIHELRRFLRAFLPSEWMNAALDDVDIWAAVGDDVATMLTDDYQVEAACVSILPGIAELTAAASRDSRHWPMRSQRVSSGVAQLSLLRSSRWRRSVRLELAKAATCSSLLG